MATTLWNGSTSTFRLLEINMVASLRLHTLNWGPMSHLVTAELKAILCWPFVAGAKTAIARRVLLLMRVHP